MLKELTELDNVNEFSLFFEIMFKQVLEKQPYHYAIFQDYWNDININLSTINLSQNNTFFLFDSLESKISTLIQFKRKKINIYYVDYSKPQIMQASSSDPKTFYQLGNICKDLF